MSGRSRCRAALVLGVLLGLGGALAAQERTGETPGATWRTASPQALGLNPLVLDSLDREIREGRYGYVDRFLVVRHGRVAFDRRYPRDYGAIYGDSARTPNALNALDPVGPYNYFNPWWHPYYRQGTLHTLQSVSKTVTSMVVGTALTRGDLTSLDVPIFSVLDTTRIANIDDRKRRITLRHLLTMTGGFDWDEGRAYNDPLNTASGLESSPDWVAFTINRPMMREPGTVFNYSSGESVLVGHLFGRLTGTDLEEYAARHLFGPLGITDWFWKRTPTGALDTEGGLYLAAPDLARLWLLMLRDGEWRGTRVLDPAFVRASVTPAVPVDAANPGGVQYGLKWWLWPDVTRPGSYVWAGSGFGGQLPMAFPALDLVVVLNGWNILPGGPGVPQRKWHERLARAVVK